MEGKFRARLRMVGTWESIKGDMERVGFDERGIRRGRVKINKK
jgi:hypothetical protein